MKQLIVLLGLGILLGSCGKDKDPSVNTFTYSNWDLVLSEEMLIAKDTVRDIDTFVQKADIQGYKLTSFFSSGTATSTDFYIKNDSLKFLDSHPWFIKGEYAIIQKISENILVLEWNRYKDWASKPISYPVYRYTFKKREEAYKSQAGCATCWQTLTNNERYIKGFANNGFDFISDNKLGIICGQQLSNYKNDSISDKLVGGVTYRTTTFCKE